MCQVPIHLFIEQGFLTSHKYAFQIRKNFLFKCDILFQNYNTHEISTTTKAGRLVSDQPLHMLESDHTTVMHEQKILYCTNTDKFNCISSREANPFTNTWNELVHCHWCLKWHICSFSKGEFHFNLPNWNKTSPRTFCSILCLFYSLWPGMPQTGLTTNIIG